MDIVEFLTAQYDADEKTATGLRDMVRKLAELNDSRSPATRNGTHIYDAGAWALDRMLADVPSKRKRLALHTRHDADPHIYGAAWCEFCTHLDYDGDEDHQHIEPWPCLHLRIDAVPYAGRSGYNPAWTVESNT